MRWTVNCSILFSHLPLLERPAAARSAGFDAVEFWWPFETSVPPAAEVEQFVQAITDAGVQLTGINFAAGSLPDGERGFASTPGRTAEFRESVLVAAELGERLGTGIYNALYGNRIAGVEPAEQDEIAVGNLEFAASTVRGVVAVEPLSGVSSYPLRTVADVLAVLDRLEAPNVGVLADLYHLAVNGEDIAAAIQLHSGRFAHVQIADAPGRHEPGTGGIAFDGHLDALTRFGYTGLIGLEYLASQPDPFAWLPISQRGSPVGDRS